MKLLWILFTVLIDLTFKLMMIVLGFYVVVGIGMGLYWILFESGAGLLLLGVTVLVIIVKVAGAAAGDSGE